MSTNKIVILPTVGPPMLVELEGPEDRDAQVYGLLAHDDVFLPLDVISLTDRPGGLDMWVRDPAWCGEYRNEPNLIATAVAGRYALVGAVIAGPVAFASTEVDEVAGELRMAGLSESQLEDLQCTIEMYWTVYGYDMNWTWETCSDQDR